MKKHARARRDRIVIFTALAFAVVFAVVLMVAVADDKKLRTHKNETIAADENGFRDSRRFYAQDGDTLITPNGKYVRLLCIDAPEKDQRHGVRAQRFLAALIKNGVVIHAKGKDRYGRTLAIVTVGDDGLIVNHEMLRQGHAWVYRRFSGNCGLPEKPLFAMEKQARNASLGLWRNKNPIPPWRWRQKYR